MESGDILDLNQVGKIYAGEVHYSRIPVEYWEHRIQMIKALGLNTLSVYIMWNYHELSKGQYDFETGNKNLPLFLKLAEKYNMMVLFRPGPYVCAQWDFGGLPARLHNIEGLEIRANNQQFLAETKIYFQTLVPIMRPHIRNSTNPNGCIIMLQIQNQYGFYGTDKSYMQALRKIWKDLDIKCPEYYVDWLDNIKKCHWQGAHIGINDLNRDQQINAIRQFEKNGRILGGEVYSGWMTHWTQKWGGKRIEKVQEQYKYILGNGHSFAMYVVHGGTNFGLTAGANGLKDKVNDYWGAITSYDYEAPINEQGSSTPKYDKLREMIKKHADWQVPQVPQPMPMITIDSIKAKLVANLFDNLPEQCIQSPKNLVFETSELSMFNQGMTLYETILPQISDYQLSIIVHDFGLVFIGDKLIATLDRTKQTESTVAISSDLIKQNGQRLRILVEASGHINFDVNMITDKKGLYSIKGLKNENTSWKIWKFQLDKPETIFSWKPKTDKWKDFTYPALYSAQFQLTQVGDVYLDMKDYGKGYIWINGQNLGRYWQAGPQLRLFCPGAWMKKGVNELKILNVSGEAGSEIRGVKQFYHTPVNYDQ